jgi:NAD(P)-dependent dehydrogenase (short-subunit alcohol dehydrogenase family)
VHFKGVCLLTQMLTPLLADNGSIVNISTGQTRFYTPERIVYAVAEDIGNAIAALLATPTAG